MTDRVTPVAPGRSHDGDGGVGRGELDGVGQQVGEHLQQAVRIAGDFHLRGVVDELHACRVGHRLHAVDGLANDFGELHRAEDDRLAAALNALEIEDVVDEPDQAVGVGDGDAQQVGGLVVDLAENARGEQAQRAADGGERRAQFVADGGDEFVFQAIEGVALADVAEAEHRAGEASLVEDRGEERTRPGTGVAVACERWCLRRLPLPAEMWRGAGRSRRRSGSYGGPSRAAGRD